MASTKVEGRAHYTAQVVSGAPDIFYPNQSFPASIHVQVTTAGDAIVEATISTPEDIVAATAVWFSWTPGTITDQSNDVVVSPVVALRCTTTSTATWTVFA